jgi:hypothetical protein
MANDRDRSEGAMTNDTAMRKLSGLRTEILDAVHPAQGAVGVQWSTKERKQAARLLVEIRLHLDTQGIRSIHDPRVAMPLRKLWLRLIASNAVNSLPLEEIGRQWRCITSSPRAAVCGTAARCGGDHDITATSMGAWSTIWECDSKPGCSAELYGSA